MKKYVVTSAQRGAKVNKKFLESIKNYCKINKAELIILPIFYGNKKKRYTFDAQVEKYVISKDINLNKNLLASAIKITATAVNPLTSLQRYAKHSAIFAGTKLALKPIATSNHKLPKVIMTSGCVTEPFYPESKAGDIASKDHINAAIIVEVVDKKYFHFTQVEANSKGEFTDRFRKYSGNKVIDNLAEGIVLGDIHTNSICPLVRKATEEIIKLGKPKHIILHDLMDSFSVSHHHINDLIKNVQKSEAKTDDLQKELESVSAYLDYMNKLNKGKLIVVKSNHDEALDRYIKEGRFFTDYKNLRLSLKLCDKMLDGFDAIESYVKEMSKFKKSLKSVIFLNVDDDYQIAGIQCAKHGHIGANGARNSLRTQEIGAKKSVIGHSHSPHIFHKVWQVGTSTMLKLEYNKGFSSWMNTHCIIYKDGTRQLLNMINGKWKG